MVENINLENLTCTSLFNPKTTKILNLKLKTPFYNNYFWEKIKTENMTNMWSLCFYECFVLSSQRPLVAKYHFLKEIKFKMTKII